MILIDIIAFQNRNSNAQFENGVRKLLAAHANRPGTSIHVQAPHNI